MFPLTAASSLGFLWLSSVHGSGSSWPRAGVRSHVRVPRCCFAWLSADTPSHLIQVHLFNLTLLLSTCHAATNPPAPANSQAAPAPPPQCWLVPGLRCPPSPAPPAGEGPHWLPVCSGPPPPGSLLGSLRAPALPVLPRRAFSRVSPLDLGAGSALPLSPGIFRGSWHVEGSVKRCRSHPEG